MRKIHLTLSDETGKRLDEWVAAANKDFDEGRISHSDCAELVLSQGAPDIDQLRLRNVDLPRLLRKAAREGVNLDTALARLQSLKDGVQKAAKRVAQKAKFETEDKA